MSATTEPARTTSVDTRTAPRRNLSFATLADALADARRCAAADRAGTLRRTGNWTLGQILGHLAWWIDGAFDGYPMRPPWFVRLLGPLLKRMLLRRGGKPGMRLPGVPAGTHGTDLFSTDEGLARFERAVARLEAGPPSRPNPVFGKLTHDEWQALHRGHAELHLSFVEPRE